MVPKVEGPWDIHYVDRLLAQLEAKHKIQRPILVHAILETALGVTNVEEICAASPRMQGMSFGPADLAASRRMKTTRVGGGHPAYLVRSDPDRDHPDAPRATAQQDPWHYSIARMVDACAATGCLPFYGPFGDIGDALGCEDQFRAAFLLGCVGAWSLHPNQIAIAKKVFSPPVDEVLFAKKVLEAIPDGRGVHMIDGKMQDDATWKQCKVMVDAGRAAGAQGPRPEAGLRVLSMADTPHDPQALREQWKSGWDSAMGFRYVRASRDEVVVEYDVTDIHKQPYGIVHGGVHCGVDRGRVLDRRGDGRHGARPERGRAREPHLLRARRARRQASP